MKKLFIVRHGMAEYPNARLLDMDRCLVDDGIEEAKIVGQLLYQYEYIPDCIISSPASRAHQTAKIISEILHISTKDIKYDKTIYEAEVTHLLQLISQLKDRYNSVLIVGHNPGLSELVNHLINMMGYSLETGGVFGLESSAGSWTDFLSSNIQKLFSDRTNKQI